MVLTINAVCVNSICILKSANFICKFRHVRQNILGNLSGKYVTWSILK